MLRLISAITGWLVHFPLFKPLSTFSIKVFANMYKIDTDAAEFPINHYKSIGDFFTRDLKAGLRPVADGFVSPVDGTLREVSKVKSARAIQVKNKDYSVADLFGSADLAREFEEGTLLNFYLSPRDAHHIFAPCDGKVLEVKRISGNLYPVNDWALNNINNLFCLNERVCILLESSYGKVAVVMVGALNVGSIVVQEGVSQGTKIQRGQKIGTFRMGSSVLVLLPDGEFKPAVSPGKINYGSRII